jgi:hypothetical protein
MIPNNSYLSADQILLCLQNTIQYNLKDVTSFEKNCGSKTSCKVFKGKVCYFILRLKKGQF